jgi:hypothetical protein
MTDQEPASPAKRYARELVAMSDAELDSYLERHRAASGLIFIEVHDPENIPDSLIERLRFVASVTPHPSPQLTAL